MVTSKKKHLSQVDKARGLAWWEEGVGVGEVAKRLRVNRKTISTLVAAYQKNNNGKLPMAAD